MKYAELARKLRRLGAEFRRHGRGSHEIWWRPDKKLYTTVPRHGGDIALGTLSKILRDLNIDKDEFDRA